MLSLSTPGNRSEFHLLYKNDVSVADVLRCPVVKPAFCADNAENMYTPSKETVAKRTRTIVESSSPVVRSITLVHTTNGGHDNFQLCTIWACYPKRYCRSSALEAYADAICNMPWNYYGFSSYGRHASVFSPLSSFFRTSLTNRRGCFFFLIKHKSITFFFCTHHQLFSFFLIT